jgi:hypothetical protein
MILGRVPRVLRAITVPVNLDQDLLSGFEIYRPDPPEAAVSGTAFEVQDHGHG